MEQPERVKMQVEHPIKDARYSRMTFGPPLSEATALAPLPTAGVALILSGVVMALGAAAAVV